MANNNLSLIVDVKTVGEESLNRVAAGLERIAQQGEKTGKSTGQSFSSFPAQIKQAVQDPLGAAEQNIVRFASSFGTVGIAAGAAIGGLSAAIAASAAATRSLGDLGIETQNLSVKMGLTTREVGQFQFAARASGQDIGVFETGMRKLSQGLADGGEEGKKAREALSDLGVKTRTLAGEIRPTSDILEQIAAGLGNIGEPARRNAEVLKIFGRAGIELVPVLAHLNENIARSKELGVGLSDAELSKFTKYHQQITDVDTAWEIAKRHFSEGIAGTIFISLKGAGAALLNSLSGHSDPAKTEIEGVHSGTKGTVQSYLLSQIGNFGTPEGGGIGKDEAAFAKTLTGAQSALEDAKGRASEVRADYFSSKGQVTQDVADRKREAWEKAEAAVKSYERALDALGNPKRQQEALRSSQELSYRSSYDPAAGRDIRGELLKATTYVDKDGEVQHYELLDGTRRNIEAAFGTYTLSLNQKASESQIKSEEESFAKRLSYEGKIFEERQKYTEQTGQLALSTIDGTFSHQSTLAGYDRDERLKALDISGIGLTGSAATRNALASITQRKEIADQFSLATATNDSEALDRDKRRQLLANAGERVTGQITDDQYFDRSKVINESAGQKGTEINDRYAQDLLTAQQDAVASTTEIIKRLENEQIDKIKGFAGGLFDAAISRDPRAIPEFLKSQVLGVGKTIAENAGGLASKAIIPLIPHVTDANSTIGKLLQNTPFGAKPEDLLKTSTDLNTAATNANTAKLESLKVSATSPSGGGGSASGLTGALGAGGVFSGSSGSPFIFNAQDGSISISPTAGAGVPFVPNDLDGLTPAAASVSAGGSGGLFSAKNVAGAAAIGGGAFSAVKGFERGGAGGALQGAGGILDAGAGIAALIPGGQLVALGLGIAGAVTGLIGGFINSPAHREAAINQEISAAQYLAPTALNLTQSTNGKYSSFDARGGLRTSNLSPYPETTNPFVWEQTHGLFGGPPTYFDVPGRTTSPFSPAPPAAPIVQHIYQAGAIQTMDADSFHGFLQKNSNAVGEAAATHLQNTSGNSRLSTELRYATSN